MKKKLAGVILTVVMILILSTIVYAGLGCGPPM